jgi:arginine-tRNA-protein transferase
MNDGSSLTGRADAPITAGSRPQQFFVLRETPCPYIPGRMERKLVTELSPRGWPDSYSDLSRAGFRRSHLFAYRPACRGCEACVPVRVDAARYAPSKSLRRIANRNADLTGTLRPPVSTYEQYLLFQRYLKSRHADGDMARMSYGDFRAMVEETTAATRVVEFRDAEGRLVAGCLLDLLDDGCSAVYSFFEPAEHARSLGTFIIHWAIADTRMRGQRYVYLGYWIAQSRKMAYKTRFRPLEALGPRGWRDLRVPDGAHVGDAGGDAGFTG